MEVQVAETVNKDPLACDSGQVSKSCLVLVLPSLNMKIMLSLLRYSFAESM